MRVGSPEALASATACRIVAGVMESAAAGLDGTGDAPEFLEWATMFKTRAAKLEGSGSTPTPPKREPLRLVRS